MTIIKTTKPYAVQSWPDENAVPCGYALVQDGFDLSALFDNSAQVTLETALDEETMTYTLVGIEVDEEALEAYKNSRTNADVCSDRESAYSTEALIEWGERYYTVDEMNTEFMRALAEGDLEDQSEIRALIVSAKEEVRLRYPKVEE